MNNQDFIEKNNFSFKEVLFVFLFIFCTIFYLSQIFFLLTKKEHRVAKGTSIITPTGPTINDEKAEFELHIKELKSKLASWNSQLEAFKQKIHGYYRKKSQDPLNLLRVEENITAINNITIPKLIDSKRVREDLKDAKEFAQDMKHNVIKRRYDIFEGPKNSEDSKRALQLKCIEYRGELENLGKLKKKGELIKLANEYLQNRNGFMESFAKPINKNDISKAVEPIAELYGLDILLATMNKFIEDIENAKKEETSLGLLTGASFFHRFKLLRDKVKQDFDSLSSQSYKNKLTNFEIKYSTALTEMKTMVQELIQSGELKPIK